MTYDWSVAGFKKLLLDSCASEAHLYNHCNEVAERVYQ